MNTSNICRLLPVNNLLLCGQQLQTNVNNNNNNNNNGRFKPRHSISTAFRAATARHSAGDWCGWYATRDEHLCPISVAVQHKSTRVALIV